MKMVIAYIWPTEEFASIGEEIQMISWAHSNSIADAPHNLVDVNIKTFVE